MAALDSSGEARDKAAPASKKQRSGATAQANQKKGRAEPGLESAQPRGRGLRLRGLTLFGEAQRAPVAFLAALTCLVMVSLVVSNEPLASAPIASEVFSETPRTSCVLA